MNIYLAGDSIVQNYTDDGSRGAIAALLCKEK